MSWHPGCAFLCPSWGLGLFTVFRLPQCSGILFLPVHAARGLECAVWPLLGLSEGLSDTGGGLPVCFCVDMLASTVTLALLLVAATWGFWVGVYGCSLSVDSGGLDGSRRVLSFLLVSLSLLECLVSGFYSGGWMLERIMHVCSQV